MEAEFDGMDFKSCRNQVPKAYYKMVELILRQLDDFFDELMIDQVGAVVVSHLGRPIYRLRIQNPVCKSKKSKPGEFSLCINWTELLHKIEAMEEGTNVKGYADDSFLVRWANKVYDWLFPETKRM